MYMNTHIYIYVYRLVYKDFALDVPASCVAHGAHQARSVHKQPLCRIRQQTLSRQRVLYKKSAGFRRVSQTSVRVGGRNKTGQGSRKCACICTHTYTYMCIGLYIKTLPWMCQLLVWRMVPIRRAQCINNLCRIHQRTLSRQRVLYKKSAGSGGYLRQQCGWGVETRPVRALGSVHVYVHTHIHTCI